MDHVLHLNEFFIEGGNPERSHVLLHITEPSTPEEKQQGYFFALAELNQAETKHIAKLQEIIDRIESDYYQTTPGDTNAFENVLQKMNEEAYGLVKPELELHCIAGVIRQSEIVFAYYGRPHLLLFYKTRQGTYQKMDLLQDAGNAEEPAEEQLFSNIIQGKISPGDFMLVGTPHVINYFSADRLEKIITTRPARQSAEHIERVLSEIRDGLSFGGLIMHIAGAVEPGGALKAPRPAGKETSAVSLQNLFTTERQTAETLSASLIPRLDTKIRSFLQRSSASAPQAGQGAAKPSAGFTAEIRSTHLTSPRPRPERRGAGPGRGSELARIAFQYLSIALRALGRALLWLAMAVYSLALAIFRNLGLLFLAATNFRNRRQNVLDDWRRSWRSHKENFRQLPLVTKIILGASVCLSVILLVSIATVRARQEHAAAERAFTEAVKNIRAKKDTADSSLTYQNDTTALKELQEAKATLAGLSCDKDRQATCTAVSDELEQLLVRIRRLSIITPELVAEWPEAKLADLTRVGNKLIGSSEQSAALYVYDLLSKQSSVKMADSSIKGFAGSATPKENDYSVFVFDKNRLLSLNPADLASKTIDVSFPNEGTDLASVIVYNRRLYSLDRAGGQLYKHDSIKAGFERGKPWIRETDANFSDAVSVAIDGDIFVLHQTGKVEKFTVGARQPFALQAVDPQLANGSAIWTYTDLEYLYILDNAGKRLLIFDKSGRLKHQLTAKEFVNPSGMVVDEAGKTAYVVDEGKLYKLTLP